MAAQSSGATAPTGKVVDLVASDWFGGETDCAPLINGCPDDYPIEAAAGTSEASPLIAGAAADVIQAYRATHNGASPTPAMIKDILTGTATSIDAPADQQGAGLLNVYAAVRAAQQMPGTTYDRGPGDAPSLISTPSQLDITGDGGSVSDQSVSLYNASTQPTRVTGSYRWISPEFPISRVVTENVSAPDPSLPVPVAGATAASSITFNVPPHLSRLDADMIWPDPTNSNVLEFVLFNPQGAVVQESYDDGTPGQAGSAPNDPACRGHRSHSRPVDGEVPVGRHRRLRRARAGHAGHLHRPDVLPGLRAGLSHRARRAAGHHPGPLERVGAAAGRHARPAGRLARVAAAAGQ